MGQVCGLTLGETQFPAHVFLLGENKQETTSDSEALEFF